jgi:hypothetical protein
MNVADALERLQAIQEQLAKGEVYRGHSPWTVGLSGGVGLLAALVQPWLVGTADGELFLGYWLLVGVGCGLLASSSALPGLLFARGERVQRGWTVAGQFLPCLLAGGFVTVALSRPGLAPGGLRLLPGLWAILFGLGIVASKPYLPRSASWVAGWYLLAGMLVLLQAEGPGAFSGWTMGIPFGLGQLGMALVCQAARRGEV